MINGHQTIAVIDFGGLYKGQIASIVRNCNVHATILHSDTPIGKIKEMSPIGIILTGGPHNVYKKNAPHVSAEIFELGIPVLGICYGMQLMAYTLGGCVRQCKVKECGSTLTYFDDGKCALFKGIEEPAFMLMSHSDFVSALPQGFHVNAHTADCVIAGMSDDRRKLYGVQFHPEAERSQQGYKIIRNFVFEVCNASGDYDAENFLQQAISDIRDQAGDSKVILGLSGGLDSCVCARILEKALPDQLVSVYVDNGLMREGESEQTEKLLVENGIKYIKVDAKDRFIKILSGITHPEEKRKAVGREFIKIFEEIGKDLGKCYFAQGTIQSDVVESGTENSALIKSYHNVGGLPENNGFEGIIEPLRALFKNEVKILAEKLGLTDGIANTQPFPGPGLSIRIIGEVTQEKLDILRKADKIYCEELKKTNLRPDQYFAVLTDMKTVGVMGDDRAYSRVIALRAVKTSDFMTCEYVRIPYDVLDVITTRIINEVKGISRVVYDITGKPPATIEWE